MRLTPAGVKMWKANPTDGTGYQYFKYHLVVKHLLEQEKLTVDELFNRDLNQTQWEQKVLGTFSHKKAQKAQRHKRNHQVYSHCQNSVAQELAFTGSAA